MMQVFLSSTSATLEKKIYSIGMHIAGVAWEILYSLGAILGGITTTRHSLYMHAGNGDMITVSSSEPLMMLSIVRMGSATHSTNTDQRRIELCGPFSTACNGDEVALTIPEDPGVAVKGNWMIFGLNAAGTPSVAKILSIT